MAKVAPVSAPLLPPTSVLRDAPGVNAAKFVPVFGSDCNTSIWIVFCCVTFCVSTIGDCPETVIVSSSEPTLRSALIVAVKPADSSIPSRLKVLNPASVNVTEYTPGRRSTTLYCPSPSVTALRTFSINAGLDTSTVTPGNTPPDVSRTTPAIVPAACAYTAAGNTASRHTNPNTFHVFMRPPAARG